MCIVHSPAVSTVFSGFVHLTIMSLPLCLLAGATAPRHPLAPHAPDDDDDDDGPPRRCCCCCITRADEHEIAAIVSHVHTHSLSLLLFLSLCQAVSICHSTSPTFPRVCVCVCVCLSLPRLLVARPLRLSRSLFFFVLFLGSFFLLLIVIVFSYFTIYDILSILMSIKRRKENISTPSPRSDNLTRMDNKFPQSIKITERTVYKMVMEVIL